MIHLDRSSSNARDLITVTMNNLEPYTSYNLVIDGPSVFIYKPFTTANVTKVTMTIEAYTISRNLCSGETICVDFYLEGLRNQAKTVEVHG